MRPTFNVKASSSSNPTAVPRASYSLQVMYSTALAISVLIDNISNAIENEQHVIGVFLDFVKVFDTVNHRILLVKLAHYAHLDVIMALYYNNIEAINSNDINTVTSSYRRRGRKRQKN